MPDQMDAVQQLVLERQERLMMRQAPGIGLHDCIRCDEPISELRRNLGAQLCMECQAADEAKQRARGGR